MFITDATAAPKKGRSLFRRVKSAADNVTVGVAATAEEAGVAEAALKARRAPCKISEIKIPEDIVIVKDSFRGTKKRLIVHIQDAHCNYEAQSNISKMINNMAENNELKLLAF